MSTNHYHVGLFRHSSNLKSYPAGSTVFSAGDIGRVMYAVKTGKVSVSIDGQPVDYLGEDEIFGEMALLENLPRSATVMAVEETTLVEIDEVQFLNTVRQNPYFALQMLKILSARLRQSKVT
ncbi:hypothetical protein LBMAG53_31600 [Planctomycetota bacterium]|nr:hypothetical protein LBMAG53_31600 [Planctomycetota bacterium]